VRPAALVLAVLWLSVSAPAQAQQGLLVVSRGNAKVLEYDASDGSFVATFVEPVSEGFAVFALSDLIFDPTKLDGKQGMGNVGNVKIVSTHTSGDGLVIVAQEQPYRDSVPASNITVAVVNEAGNTHCGFSGAELTAGWESLRTWVATDTQPSVAAIQGTCLAIEDIFGGPCRYDPSFVIPNMDIRVPPR
jgi:hypothetical protein